MRVKQADDSRTLRIQRMEPEGGIYGAFMIKIQHECLFVCLAVAMESQVRIAETLRVNRKNKAYGWVACSLTQLPLSLEFYGGIAGEWEFMVEG